MVKDRRIPTVLLIVVCAIVGLAMVVKPHEPIKTLSDPAKLLESPVGVIGDSSFAEKVVNGVSLGVVLHHSEYSAEHANALEALRTWAARQFHSDPRFLHPVIIAEPVANSTVLNSSAYSVFAAPYYAVSGMLSDFLSGRIAQYDKSASFTTFARDYFDYFGREPEAATLLARYQSDRAKAAVNPLMALLFLVLSLVAARAFVPRLFDKANWWRYPVNPEGAFAASCLAYGLFAYGSFYFAQSVVVEAVAGQSIAAGVLCLLSGLYVLFPVALFIDGEQVLILRSGLSMSRVLCGAWIFASLVVVQLLTWLKQGVLTSPDPLTLLICGFSGDFLHEPTVAKRYMAMTVAVLWSLASTLVLRKLTAPAGVSTREVAKKLEKLTTGL